MVQPALPSRICRPPMIYADARCAGCLVRATLERGGVPESGLAAVLASCENFTLRAKGALYRQDAPAQALYAIRRGMLKLVRAGASPRIVRLLRAGDLAGVEAVLGGAYRHSAVAIEPVECCRIPPVVVERLRAAGASFYAELGRRWQAALDEADAFIASLASGSAEQRLARLLVKVAGMSSEGGCVSLPRSDIGAALGVSMETASRLMADFQRRGLVRKAGRRVACDTGALGEIVLKKGDRS